MQEFVAETGSTNADLLARLCAGEPIGEGHWLIADRQISGRGRQGREWFDGSGNFMGSTVVHAQHGDPPMSSLSFMVGLAVFEALQAYLAQPADLRLKWPNDAMLKGAKLAGILLEGQGHSIVVGIGVNLAASPELPDRQTIALSDVGPAPDRDAFANSLATCFAAEIKRWRTFGMAALLRRWMAAAHPTGTPLRVHESDRTFIEGTFAGLADDGALLLSLADGSTRAIHAGDVTPV